jgi:putative tryptophan/tyrosine transport system substrate-binding protein
MRRRTFIAALGGAAAWPLVARGQQAGRVYRVALIFPANPVADITENGPSQFIRTFLLELRRLGYVEGQNLILDRFSGEGRAERYADVARDAVARQPDLIFTLGDAIPRRLQQASLVIPIVAMVADPIANGLSTSLARPDGNLTGVSIDAGLEIWGKRLADLKETVVSLSSVGVLGSKRWWEDQSQTTPLRDAARQLGISLVGCTIDGPLQEAEYRRVLAAIPENRLDGLVVGSEAENFTYRNIIVELVAKAKLPTIYPFREYVELGGLMAYAADLHDIYRQAARQIDEILKGTKPSDIPFYQPTKFELIVNLKTAHALGVTLPARLLAQADEVIE